MKILKMKRVRRIELGHAAGQHDVIALRNGGQVFLVDPHGIYEVSRGKLIRRSDLLFDLRSTYVSNSGYSYTNELTIPDFEEIPVPVNRIDAYWKNWYIPRAKYPEWFKLVGSYVVFYNYDTSEISLQSLTAYSENLIFGSTIYDYFTNETIGERIILKRKYTFKEETYTEKRNIFLLEKETPYPVKSRILSKDDTYVVYSFDPDPRANWIEKFIDDNKVRVKFIVPTKTFQLEFEYEGTNYFVEVDTSNGEIQRAFKEVGKDEYGYPKNKKLTDSEIKNIPLQTVIFGNDPAHVLLIKPKNLILKRIGLWW